MNETLMRLQQDLKDLGLYTDVVDGIWGKHSQAAWAACIDKVKGTMSRKPIAWGAKVSSVFLDKVVRICEDLGLNDPSDLMACIAWESGRSFSPKIYNGAGSGAVGLIQFMPATARGLGTTTTALAAMTAEDQLDYVHKYFQPYKGRLKNLGDLYMAILWPAAIGKPDSYVLWDASSRPTTYRQNIGLDVNKDGAITRAECLVKVNGLLTEGLKPGNVK